MATFLKYNNKETEFDEDQVDPSKGVPVTQIVPCLDPYTPESEKIDFEVMSKRTL